MLKLHIKSFPSSTTRIHVQVHVILENKLLNERILCYFILKQLLLTLTHHSKHSWFGSAVQVAISNSSNSARKMDLIDRVCLYVDHLISCVAPKSSGFYALHAQTKFIKRKAITIIGQKVTVVLSFLLHFLSLVER